MIGAGILSFLSALFVFTFTAHPFLELAYQFPISFIRGMRQFFFRSVVIDHGLFDAEPFLHHGNGVDLSFANPIVYRIARNTKQV